MDDRQSACSDCRTVVQVPTWSASDHSASCPMEVVNCIQTSVGRRAHVCTIELPPRGNRAFRETCVAEPILASVALALKHVRRKGRPCIRHSTIDVSHPWPWTRALCVGGRSLLPWSSLIRPARAGKFARTHARSVGQPIRGSSCVRPTTEHRYWRRNRHRQARHTYRTRIEGENDATHSFRSCDNSRPALLQ